MRRKTALALSLLGSLYVVGCGGGSGGGGNTQVQKTTPTITWSNPAAITAGTALSVTQLNATASVPGTFVYTPAAGTVPAVGTDTLLVTFTPTDTTDYNSVTANVLLTVNPAVPTITSFTIAGSRYAVEDNFSNTFLPYSIAGPNFQAGDDILVTTASGTGSTTLTTAATTLSGIVNFNALDYEPQFVTAIDQRGGVNSNQYSVAFLGSASQSTAAVSATTGTVFQVEQKTGKVNMLNTDGTTGILFPIGQAGTPTAIALDDTTGNIAYLFTGKNDIAVYTQSGTRVCDVTPNMAFVSSIAAKGGYMVFTDPTDNTVGIAKMDCSGYHTIPVAGQPWAVAMASNGGVLYAYVLSRDKASANGLPMVTKINVATGATEGTVELTGFTPISTIRATTPYQGLFSVQASSLTSMAAVLFMSDQTDGTVLIISTDTSNGKTMKITHSVAVPELPIGIAMQDSATDPIVWVAKLLANSGEAVTHIDAIDSVTGNYTSGIGACQTGILAGGFVATSNGVYCAMGSTIAAPLVLQP